MYTDLKLENAQKRTDTAQKRTKTHKNAQNLFY